MLSYVTTCTLCADGSVPRAHVVHLFGMLA